MRFVRGDVRDHVGALRIRRHRPIEQAVVGAYDFSQFCHVADIGGGQGQLLSGILTANPYLRGTLFDQPHVVSRAKDVLASYGLTERCRIVSGSFFDAVPQGADASDPASTRSID